MAIVSKKIAPTKAKRERGSTPSVPSANIRPIDRNLLAELLDDEIESVKGPKASENGSKTDSCSTGKNTYNRLEPDASRSKNEESSAKKEEGNVPDAKNPLQGSQDLTSELYLEKYLEAEGIPNAFHFVIIGKFKRVIADTKIELSAQKKRRPSKKASQADKPPLPELTPKQIAAVIQRGKDRPWSERPTHFMSPFEWVRKNYKEWAGRGLLQSHLKAADEALYGAFAKRVSREGLPDDLDVPTEPDAKLRRTTDPQERAKLLAARESFKKPRLIPNNGL